MGSNINLRKAVSAYTLVKINPFFIRVPFLRFKQRCLDYLKKILAKLSAQ